VTAAGPLFCSCSINCVFLLGKSLMDRQIIVLFRIVRPYVSILTCSDSCLCAGIFLGTRTVFDIIIL